MTAQPAPPRPAAVGWRRRAAAVAALATGAGLLTLVPGAAAPAAADGLRPWDDCAAMLAHYRAQLERTATPWGVGDGGPVLASDTRSGALVGTASGRESAAVVGDAVGAGPTGTNLQEQGVDEPDTAKLAGDHVVAVAEGRLQVVRGGAAPRLVGTLALGPDVGPAELLVDGARVLVVAGGWRPLPGGPVTEPDVPPLPGPADAGAWSGRADASVVRVLPAPGEPHVRLVLVDLAQPARPRVLESLELDGSVVSARLVDGTVRVVTRSTPRVPGVQPEQPGVPESEQAARAANRSAARQATLEQVLPTRVRRDADGTELARSPAVACTSVHAPVGTAAGAGTLLVTTLHPRSGLEPVDATAVTADGELVHASTDRLHVVTSRWGAVAPAADGSVPAPDEATTELHAFDTSSPERTRYVASGSVPGHVVGRWALSRHEGHLRVATTTAAPWDGSGTSSSSVVVLAEQGGRLVERGRLDGLGLTEQIHAVRWFGDVGTVVTFRRTDPLYVLDLSDPTSPRVRGELEVPGFSTYLHPVGGDLLLGVGQDADADGQVTGLQLSLFDLSDPAAPTQLDRLSLGQGWSPALDDSRAFGFDAERRLAVLPFTSWSAGAGTSAALGVRVDGDRLVEAGRLAVGPDTAVERVLLDGASAYAVTSRGVVAMDPVSLRRTGSAAFGR
jgi:hypothetical protein